MRALDFADDPPDGAALSRAWHRMLDDARKVVGLLPPEHAGTCVLNHDGMLCRADVGDVPSLVSANALRFHAGRIRGALPQLVPEH